MEAQAKKVYMKVWWKNHPEERRRYNRVAYLKDRKARIKSATERNKNNPEVRKKYYERGKCRYPTKRRERYLQKTYGLSLSQYEVMFKNQKGICAICTKEFPKLVIDHNHQTLTLRGLLCVKCNAGLGQFNDDVELLKRAMLYLG